MSVRAVDVLEAVEPLAEYAQQVKEEPVVVTSEGRETRRAGEGDFACNRKPDSETIRLAGALCIPLG